MTSRMIKFSELEKDDFLKTGWTQDCMEGEVIETDVESLTDSWTAEQVWGMSEINGERRQVRKVLTKKGEKVFRLSVVYDWVA